MTWEIAIVSTGIVLFTAALDQFRRAYLLSRPKKHAIRWIGLAVLVLAFLVGYLLFIDHLLNAEAPDSTDRLVSIIFFGGSAFVLVCAHLFSTTTHDLIGLLETNELQRDQLADQAGALSRKVDRKSLELAQEKARLAEETSRGEQLKKERLEARMVAKQRLDGIAIMASGIAHDFNNLLVGILGNASYVRQLGPREGVDFEEAMADVESAAERAAELTQQLNDYCGRGPAALDLVDLSAMTAEVLSLIRTSIDAKVTVVTDLLAELPPIWGDPSRLQQFVMNLVNNGCEAILPATGKLSVRTGLVELTQAEIDSDWMEDMADPGPYIFLEIEDDGCGVSNSDQIRVFEPFFSTKGVGRGLGLAAARGIARSHGGEMRLSSVEGEGTTVTAIFPLLLRTEEAAHGGTREKIGSVRGGRILAVDDELIVLDTIRRGLTRAGYEVDTACNQSEFLELMENLEGEYSAAILDIMMPDIVFEEMLEDLRTNFPKMPILVSSGYSNLDIKQFLDTDELLGFLTKPYRVHELLEAIVNFGAVPD